MKYFGLDNKEYFLNFQKLSKNRINSSNLHKKAISFLRKQFKFYKIHEECPIKGFPKTLFFDIIIPELMICIECQGEQHEKFNSFHFDNKYEFLKAQNRDRLKKEWCELNGFKLVEFWHNESEEQWKAKL